MKSNLLNSGEIVMTTMTVGAGVPALSIVFASVEDRQAFMKLVRQLPRGTVKVDKKRLVIESVEIQNATQEGEPFTIVTTLNDGKKLVFDFIDDTPAADLRDALDAWEGLDRFERYDDRPSPKRRRAHEALLNESNVKPYAANE